MGFSIWELLVVLVIVALLFGTKKIGTLGEDIGKAFKGFRNAIKDNDEGKTDKQENASVIESAETPKKENDDSTGSP